MVPTDSIFMWNSVCPPPTEQGASASFYVFVNLTTCTLTLGESVGLSENQPSTTFGERIRTSSGTASQIIFLPLMKCHGTVSLLNIYTSQTATDLIQTRWWKNGSRGRMVTMLNGRELSNPNGERDSPRLEPYTVDHTCSNSS